MYIYIYIYNHLNLFIPESYVVLNIEPVHEPSNRGEESGVYAIM
jgi:hypothetical protein